MKKTSYFVNIKDGERGQGSGWLTQSREGSGMGWSRPANKNRPKVNAPGFSPEILCLFQLIFLDGNCSQWSACFCPSHSFCCSCKTRAMERKGRTQIQTKKPHCFHGRLINSGKEADTPHPPTLIKCLPNHDSAHGEAGFLFPPHWGHTLPLHLSVHNSVSLKRLYPSILRVGHIYSFIYLQF